MPRNGPDRSWFTSSPKKGAATHRPKRTRCSACTTSRSRFRAPTPTQPAASYRDPSSLPPAGLQGTAGRPLDHADPSAEPALEVIGESLPVTTFTDAFTRSLLRHAEADPRIIAITAAMPGPTGLLPFEARFPERCVDVGIAEQHAVTAAAGMAMAGMRPVVAVYSTFFSRAFDQANLDVGLHRLPVVLVLDRAGITGDDGPSHHGLVDMALALSIPGMTVFAPSSAPEVEAMLTQALALDGPSIIRFPKTPAPSVLPGEVGEGMSARCARSGDGSVCILAVGKMSRPPSRPPQSSKRRASMPPSGMCGWFPTPIRPCWPVLPPTGWWSPLRTASVTEGQACSWPTLCAARWAVVPPPCHFAGRSPLLHRPGQARPHPGPTRTGRARPGPDGAGGGTGPSGAGPARTTGPSRCGPTGHRHRPSTPPLKAPPAAPPLFAA